MRRLLLLGLICLLAAGAAPAARIVAVGDVHGEIDGFDSVLRAAGLMDRDGGWIGGDAVLVQTGDVTDRGSRVRQVMDRLRSLEDQAPAHGGRVVALLGNHEVSNLIHLFDELSTPAEVYHQIWDGFADGKSKKRQKAAYRRWYGWLERYPGCVKQENYAWREDREAWLADHPPGFVEYIEAVSEEGEYGRWLRGLGIAAQIDGTVFMHGGLSRELVLEQGYRSVAALNRAARQALEQLDADRRWLIGEKLIVPFSTLWEMHCALFVEMARLEEKGKPEALARRGELEELRSRLPGMPGWFLTQETGPLWFRGLANGEEAEIALDLDGIFEAFGAKRIAVGHTPQMGEIRSRFDGRVFLIDTAMAYPELGGGAAALEIDGDRVTAIYPDRRVDLTAPPQPAAEAAAGDPPAPAEGANDDDAEPVEGTNGHRAEPVEGTNGHDAEPVEGIDGQDAAGAGPGAGRQDQQAEPGTAEPQEAVAEPAAPAEPPWLGPDGEPLPFREVGEVLEFLAKAKVVKSSAVPTGVTLPRKLTLERDGVRAHAIFHTVEIEKRRERLRGGTLVNFFRDHYANNVAAFELSRMLAMTNVPPAVVRKVGRTKGSVQLWIEGSRTEAERRQLGVKPPGDWALTARDMYVFDNLANNIDRNQGNILYDANWNLWFIDHTRSFGRLKSLPEPTRVRRCSRRLWRALQDLDEQEVRQRLRPYLGGYEIDGLMVRRDLLVSLIEEKIASQGEAAVLFDYDSPSASPVDEPEDPSIPEAPPD